MSPWSPSGNERPSLFAGHELSSTLAGYGTGLKTGVTSLAFWTAVVLPFIYIPLLAAGLESASTVAAFVGLLGLNVVALFVGQPHHRE